MIFNESGRERGEELSKLPYSEVRFLDKHAHSPAAINVYANKVFIIIGSKTNPIGILIEDEGVSRDFLAYFNVLWENTTK